MKDRINHFLKFNKISSSQLADSLNIQRSRLSHILSGRNKPNLEFIQKMLDTYKTINPRWLILGEGNMFKDDVDELSPQIKRQNDSSELFSQTSTQKIKNQKPSIENVTIKVKSRKIDKIVIFYSDNSFENYIPSESEI